jgi:hypothetical protein
MVTRGFAGRQSGSELSDRIPPEHLVENFPVLTAGPTPSIEPANWTFTLKIGPRPVKAWNWSEFNTLPRTKMTRGIHCVTSWSGPAPTRAASLLLEVGEALTRKPAMRSTDFSGWIDAPMVAEVAARLPASPGCAFVCGSNAFVYIAADAALALGLEAGAIKTERYGA